MTHAKDDVEARNKATVSAVFDACETGGPSDLLADDVTWTIVGNSLVSKTDTSREHFLSNVIRLFGAKLASRFVATIHDVYSEGITVIVYFDVEGTARDGKPYRSIFDL